ncbi:MAG TPA: hypothetical protein VHQ47_09725 [Phycisphaerae bacterium]|nr:hypothetical protein [Phycisphaerae bacterium]
MKREREVAVPSGGHAAIEGTRAALLERFKQQAGSAWRGEQVLFGVDAAHGGGHKEVFFAQAPRAVEILGAATEAIGGTVVAACLGGPLAAAVGVQRRDDRRLVIRRYGEGDPETVSISLDDFYGTAALLPLETLQSLFADRRWAADVAGAFPVLARHKNMTRRTAGANIACIASPEAGGVTLACATLAALTAAYHLPIEPAETALLAQKIRHTIAGDACGVWGAMASTLCPQRSMIAIRAQPHEVAAEVTIPEGWRVAAIRRRGAGNGDPAAAAGSEEHHAIGAIVQTILARAIKDLGIRKGPGGGYLANASEEHFHRYFERLLPESISGAAFLEQYGPLADRLAHLEPQQEYAPRAAAARLYGQSARARAFVESVSAAARASGASARNGAMREAQALLAGNIAAEPPTAAIVGVPAPDDAQGKAELSSWAAELGKKSGGEATVLWEESAPGAAEVPAFRVPLAELQSR